MEEIRRYAPSKYSTSYEKKALAALDDSRRQWKTYRESTSESTSERYYSWDRNYRRESQKQDWKIEVDLKSSEVIKTFSDGTKLTTEYEYFSGKKKILIKISIER